MNEPTSKAPKKSRKGSQRITVYCLPEEKKLIEENAMAAGKTASSYLLAVGQGYQVTGIVDAKQVREMAKISGDLGRLGGLLKWWLTDDARVANFTPETIRTVLSKIEDTQIELGAVMSKVIRPRLEQNK
ncbi:conjugal transfer transcriptional regulator TraJ [Shewanella baltica]|uniref:conjugal transfer transcriptional regulator TraJ n=1 Tax=Shewanella baltica TaxID=62322 RepID=UPI00217F1AFC|nr:conjugal transfer transcriptional regulator TraJ [Shewanella baltica]MCS6162436.1 conjugal transfer transcriptional regulator TraJ [Shewanella baltica]